MRKYTRLIIGLIIILLSTSETSKAFDCAPPSASINLDINNVRARLLNGGDKFWDVFVTGDPVYEIPKGSGRHSMFAASIWLSALDQGSNVYTAAQTYRQSGVDFWPGTLNAMGEIEKDECKAADKLYSVYGTEILDARDGGMPSMNIYNWPGYVADFFDANNDGLYEPSQGDYPLFDRNHPSLIPGQMVFWTINDKGNIHKSIPNNLSMGVEIHMTAYAFASRSSNAINNSTFYRYKIINKSSITYTHFRVGEFADADLGNYEDDYVGCDLSTNLAGKKRNLFYTYNGDAIDENAGSPGYGSYPPAIGVCYLNTGKDASGLSLGVNSFIFMSNSAIQGVNTNPETPIELIRYMLGLWANSETIKYGSIDGRSQGEDYKFVFPGDTDPGGRAAWYESANPGDRRMVSTIDARRFEPGEQMTVELGYIWAQDFNTTSSVRPSVELLRLSTDTVIEAYNNNFSGFTTNINNNKRVSLNVHPNPSKEVLYLNHEAVITYIGIYDINGKLVKEIEETNTRKIDINDLKEGVYLIRVNDSIVRFVKM